MKHTNIFMVIAFCLGFTLLILIAAQQADASTEGLAYHREQAALKLAITKKVKALEYRAKFATVTAYTAVESCTNTNCAMANGMKAQVGYAACPRKIAMGTQIQIEGIGTYTCGDRTALRVDGRYDLFFGYEQKDHDRAIQFGKQIRQVTIL